MKVLLVWSAPSPYRTAFFNCLGCLCDLTVIYERKYSRDRMREWQDSVKAIHYKEIFLKGIMVGNEQGFCPSVIKYLKPSLYDIIMIGGYSTPTGMLSILYLSGRKIPFLLNADGGIIGDDSFLKFHVKKFFISRASTWLSSGYNTDQYLIHYGADPACIEWYPQTSVLAEYIDNEPINMIEKQQLRCRLGITENKVVVSVGQFIYRKGFDLLIKSAANLDEDTGVYIIGGEPTVEYLTLIKQYNIQNVHFIKFATQSEIKSFFRASDLFVMPTRYDIWGLVINEAMSSGLPVITTDKCIAGLELVENNKNGFIVSAGDVRELAQKIISTLKDDQLRAEMAWESLKKIQYYSIENMAKTHFDIFSKLLAKRDCEV